MHQAIVNIILDQVRTQFISETICYSQFLDVTKDEWENWKKGLFPLPNEKMQKLKGLFSDYEWMLIQKIARQATRFPEKRNYVVLEYKQLKSIIAKEWIKSEFTKVELITQQSVLQRKDSNYPKKQMVNLRVYISYGEWGFDDILEFCMPGIIQQQITDSKVDLLEWVDENLIDAYTENEVKETN